MPVDERDFNLISDHTIQDAQALLATDGAFKNKVVYIAGWLVHQHDLDDMSEDSTCEFLEELNRGGLSIPSLNVVFFVYSAFNVFESLQKSKKHCSRYLQKLLSYIF